MARLAAPGVTTGPRCVQKQTASSRNTTPSLSMLSWRAACQAPMTVSKELEWFGRKLVSSGGVFVSPPERRRLPTSWPAIDFGRWLCSSLLLSDEGVCSATCPMARWVGCLGPDESTSVADAG